MNQKIYDIAIIGAGPIGLFAGFQAGTNNMTCAIIDTLDIVGGQCSLLYPEKNIYDIPGHEKITGQNLIDNLKKQCNRFNHDFFLSNQVIDLSKTENNIFRLETDKNLTIFSRTILIVAGNGSFNPNKPAIQNIESFENKSVFYLINDIKKFQDKIVAIAGGGDSAVDWALMLLKNQIAKKVYFIHRREDMRCHQNSLIELKEIEFSSNSLEFKIPYVVDNLIGENGELEKIILRNFNDENYKVELDVDYFLPFFGLANDISVIKKWDLDIQKNKILVNSGSMNTNLEGIYASGDICEYEGKTKLLVSGFHEAAVACHSIDKYLIKNFNKKSEAFSYSTSKF
jgi:thioredoxin reductase (NADPH)